MSKISIIRHTIYCCVYMYTKCQQIKFEPQNVQQAAAPSIYYILYSICIDHLAKRCLPSFMASYILLLYFGVNKPFCVSLRKPAALCTL